MKAIRKIEEDIILLVSDNTDKYKLEEYSDF